jgi:transcriptional regulator with XRE-family HTH domain
MGLSQPQLAAALDVSERTISRWETGATPIPPAVLLALLTIRRHRATMQGQNYPLMADVAHVMAEEGIDQDTAIRCFGVDPGTHGLQLHWRHGS